MCVFFIFFILSHDLHQLTGSAELEEDERLETRKTIPSSSNERNQTQMVFINFWCVVAS